MKNRLKWAVPVGASLAGTIVWWLHRYLTNTYPPFANDTDTVMWVAASILKLISLISIPICLNRVYLYMKQNRRNAVTAAAVWALTGILLVSVLSLLRMPIFHALNNDQAKFFPSVMMAPGNAFHSVTEYYSVIHAWQSGRIFITELLIVLLCAGFLGWMGFTVRGLKKITPGVGAVVSVWLLMTVATFGSGLLIDSYDYFLAGSLVPTVVVDVSFGFWVAMNPMTEIAFLGYSSFICSCWLLCRVFSRKGNEAHC